MSDPRSIIQTILYSIENLPLESLQKFPELERAVPKLYEALQIDDVCDHKYVNGQCVCGSVLTQDID
jgi:hypothetical protein